MNSPECEKTVLVVNDLPQMLNLLSILLTSGGYRVITAIDGCEGLEVAGQENPDLIISDVKMPNMDGIELCRRLRAEPIFHATPILLMSSELKDTPSVLEGMKAGADDYVELPCDPLRLIAKVTRLIEVKQSEKMLLKAHDQLASKVEERTAELSRSNEDLKKQIAKRKLAEAEQRRLLARIGDQQQRLNNVVASAPGVVWEAWGAPDAATQRTDFVSDYVEKMLGYSVTEWLSTPNFWLSIVHPEDAERAARESAAAFASGGDAKMEFRWIARDGHALWIESNFTVIRDDEGRSVGLRGVNIDITERKQAESEAQKNELEQRELATQVETERKRLVVAQALAKVGSWETDLATGASIWSAEMYRIFEAAPDNFQPTHSNFLPLVHPEDRPAVVKAFTRALSQDSPCLFEHRILMPDGRIKFLEERWEVVRNKQQKPVTCLGTTQDISERKQVGEVLREVARSKEESLALLDTILSSAPIGFAFLNCDLVFERINESLAAINGRSVEQHLGRTLLEVLPKIGPTVEPLCRRVIDTGMPIIDVELSGVTVAKPGEMLHWWASFYPVRMSGGEVLGVGVLVSEITERKRTEEALRESAERYLDLFESNPLPMWVFDLETLAFLAVNDAAVRHYGYSRDEFLSTTTRDIRPAEDRPAFMDKVLRRSAGIDEAGVWRHQKKDGTIIFVEITAHELIFAGRRAELVLANDVTERRRIAEIQERRSAQLALRVDVNAALAESDAPLRKTFERCTGALVQHLGAAFARIWTLNKDENVLELQASSGLYTHIDGPHARVPVGRFKIGLIAEERRSHVSNDVQHDARVSDQDWARREGMIAFAGYPLLVDDRLVGVMALFSRHTLAEDTLDALASVADLISQDIERKRIEQALQASEEQLLQAQKLESIGQLAAGIAHEINTPIQYVSDNTRFLRDAFQDLTGAIEKYDELLAAATSGPPAPELVVEVTTAIKGRDVPYLAAEIPKAIKQSLDGLERITRIVQSMKDFAHPGSKEKHAVDLNKAIESTVTVARNEWKYVAQLVTDFDHSLPLVPCLLGEFNQVILNLIINAAHAIGDVVGDGSGRKGQITITTRQMETWAEIRIQDTGNGIPESIRSRVFDPFFTTKEVGKGTGQGLSIARRVIVEKHGGSLGFETEKEHGTTFIIRLPLKETLAVPEKAEPVELVSA